MRRPAPASEGTASSKKAGKDKGKGKAQDASAHAPAAGADESTTSSRRRLRFNDQVQIRHIKNVTADKANDNEAILEMLRQRHAAGQLQDDDDDEEEDEGEEESEGEEEEDDDDDEEMEDDSGVLDDSADLDLGQDEEEDESVEYEGEDDIEDDILEEAEVESQASTEDPDVQTARRVANDLFADDDDEEMDDGPQLSTHERRQQKLAAEIAELERENVGKKDWTLIGEASAKARPVDSLLEEDLEFEHTAKVKPLVTEEVNSTLEDLIKKRILDSNFDDVVKRTQLSATPFLPSKLLELSDSKSSKSLAELYEDEYQQAKETADGAPARVSESDAKLAKEHTEIEGLFNEVFNKLDALSNAHFTPKAPKTTIQNLNNVAAMSAESAMPQTASSAAMLAPEEVYDAQAAGRESSSFTGAKGEQTPEEKKRAYNRLRKQKRKRNDRIERTKREIESARESAGIRPKVPRGKAGENQEKADAMKALLKNRGVSVVGKEAKGGKGKGQAAEPVKSASLKL